MKKDNKKTLKEKNKNQQKGKMTRKTEIEIMKYFLETSIPRLLDEENGKK